MVTTIRLVRMAPSRVGARDTANKKHAAVWNEFGRFLGLFKLNPHPPTHPPSYEKCWAKEVQHYSGYWEKVQIDSRRRAKRKGEEEGN